MKRTPVLLILVALAFAASAGGCAWLAGRYARGYPVMEMIFGSGPIQSLLMMLVALLTVGALVIGVIGLAVREAGVIRLLLLLVAGCCAAFGALAALYHWIIIQTAIRNTGVVSLEVVAPSYAETLAALSFGLFGALVALGFRAVPGRKG